MHGWELGMKVGNITRRGILGGVGMIAISGVAVAAKPPDVRVREAIVELAAALGEMHGATWIAFANHDLGLVAMSRISNAA